MNCLMAGMVPVMILAMKVLPVSHDPYRAGILVRHVHGPSRRLHHRVPQ